MCTLMYWKKGRQKGNNAAQLFVLTSWIILILRDKSDSIESACAFPGDFDDDASIKQLSELSMGNFLSFFFFV